MVDFGRKRWFLTERSGFGRFWLEKVVWVDFDQKNWRLTQKTGFGRFRPKKLILVLAGKTGFIPKKTVSGDTDRKTGYG